MKKNVLIIQRLIPHYRTGIFELLSSKLNLLVCVGKKGPKGTYINPQTKDINFKCITVKDLYLFSRNETYCYLNIIPILLKYKPEVIITEFSLGIISNYILFLLRPILNYKLILWGHGYNLTKGFDPKNSKADLLRLFLLNKTDAVLLYGYEARKVLEQYINKEKIFVAPNTLDTNRLIKLRDLFDKEGKDKIKTEIRFNNTYNLIFVGRLLADKEVDRLIDVFSQVKLKLQNVSLHIVGDGPESSALKTRSCDADIIFHGSITDEEAIGKMLYCSDLMVMPGYVGLTVVHAACFDCPSVTQKQGLNGPFHSPEIEYLIDGVTGLQTPYDENEIMADAIVNLISDRQTLQEMRKNIRILLEDTCNINLMSKGFEDAINSVYID